MTRVSIPILVGALFLSAPGRASPQDPASLRLLNLGKPGGGADSAAAIGDRRAVPLRLPDYGIPKGEKGTALFAFGGITGSYFSSLESVACDQIALTSCSVDSFGWGPAVGLLFRPFSSLPLGFGARGGRTQVSVTQRYALARLPVASVTDLDVWSATAFADGWLSLGAKTRAVGTVGWVWSWNESTVTSTFVGDRTIVEHRSQNGGRYTVGAGLERDLTDLLALRLDYRFIDGEAGDADRQHQVGLLFALGLPVAGGPRRITSSGLPNPDSPYAIRGLPLVAAGGGGGGRNTQPGDTVRVPRVVGDDLGAAQRKIRDAGLTPGQATGLSTRDPGGIVVIQSPSGDVRLSPDDVVMLHVVPPPFAPWAFEPGDTAVAPFKHCRASRLDCRRTSVPPRLSPPIYVPVPSAVNLDTTAARLRLLDVGLRSRLSLRPVDGPPDRVVDLTPRPGTRVRLDSIVELGVPDPAFQRVGPVDAIVPDLRGQDTTAAKLALADLGLRGRIVLRPVDGPPGLVIDLRPQPGDSLPVGSEVEIGVPAIIPSPAPDSVRVPTLIGLDTVSAGRRATDSLVVLGDDIDRSWSFRARGEVISQRPPPGTMVPPGSPIQVTVSRPLRRVLIVLGILLAVGLTSYSLFGAGFFKRRSKELETVGHADPTPRIVTDQSPLGGPEIRSRPVRDTGSQTISGTEGTPLGTPEIRGRPVGDPGRQSLSVEDRPMIEKEERRRK